MNVLAYYLLILFYFISASSLPPRPPNSINGRPISANAFLNRGSSLCQLTPCVSSNGIQEKNISDNLTINDNKVTIVEEDYYKTIFNQNRQSLGDKTFRDEQIPLKSDTNISVFDINKNFNFETKPKKKTGRCVDEAIQHGLNERAMMRPSSAKTRSSPISPAVDYDNVIPDDLKPSVYGYRFKRQVYGNNPDIFDTNLNTESEDAVKYRFDVNSVDNTDENPVLEDMNDTKR